VGQIYSFSIQEGAISFPFSYCGKKQLGKLKLINYINKFIVPLFFFLPLFSTVGSVGSPSGGEFSFSTFTM